MPNELLRNLNEQARAQQNKAMTKASTLRKADKATLPTGSSTMAATCSPIMGISSLEEKEKERGKQCTGTRNQATRKWGIESDEESNSALVIHDPSAGEL